VLPGLLALVGAPVELAEAEVAVSDEGAHATRLGERERLSRHRCPLNPSRISADLSAIGEFGHFLPHLLSLPERAKPLEEFESSAQVLACLGEAALPLE